MTFDFGLKCPPVNITRNGGVETSYCQISGYGGPDDMITDRVPVDVYHVDIIELSQNSTRINQANFSGSFVNGDSFTFESIVIGNMGDPIDPPKIIQFNIFATNAERQPIINIFAISFTNDCNVFPVLEEGNSAGWVYFAELEPPPRAGCPSAPSGAATEVPTEEPTNSPTQDLAQPVQTPPPTMVPTNTPTQDLAQPVQTPPPTMVPSAPSSTEQPTQSPIMTPTELPSAKPTTFPTKLQTAVPTSTPTKFPSVTPTSTPTKVIDIPTSTPSVRLSSPSAEPTLSSPSSIPVSVSPSSIPTTVQPVTTDSPESHSPTKFPVTLAPVDSEDPFSPALSMSMSIDLSRALNINEFGRDFGLSRSAHSRNKPSRKSKKSARKGAKKWASEGSQVTDHGGGEKPSKQRGVERRLRLLHI